MRWLSLLGLCLGVSLLLGCSKGGPKDGSDTFVYVGTQVGKTGGGKSQSAAQPEAQQPVKNAEARVDEKKEQPAQPAESVQRKIIYVGHLDLSVEKYEPAEESLLALIKQFKGYIAKSDDSASPGVQRTGSFTVRVPVSEFEALIAELSKLGEVRHRARDAQDVTDQYYDTEAHMKNDKVREQGLQKLYDKTAEKGRLEDVLVVDREINSVRGRIEEQEGRLKRWDKETSYSTLFVTLQQRKAVENELVGTPTFGTTLARTWEGSVDALTLFGKGLVIVIVAATPWFLLLLLVTFPLWLIIASARRRRKSQTPPAPPSAPETPPTVLPA